VPTQRSNNHSTIFLVAKEKFSIGSEDEDTEISESSKAYAMFLQILILCYQI
jgi:hypothetical protein